MASFLAGRRRMLATRGRPMTLRRANPADGGIVPADLTVQGFLFPYAPERIAGPVRQGDAQVQMLADEIAAAGWPGPPRAGDWLVVDGATWLIQGANPVF
ncbi:MAG TPA: hypothetical protein VGC09_06025, partial [Rhodopila sp.]